MARSTTSRCSSARENLDSGSPTAAGSSHAIALTSATCSGGKTARATRARLVLKSVQALLGEPSSPLADDPRRRVEARRDVGVVQTLNCVKHDPCALNLLPRTLLSPRGPDQLGALLLAEFDPVTSRARHRKEDSTHPPRFLQRVPARTSGRVY